MSELAAKLARRRMLNGEQNGSDSTLTPVSSTTSRLPAHEPIQVPKSSTSNELISKLARRRHLNGEATTAIVQETPDCTIVTSVQQPIIAVALPEAVDTVTLAMVESNTNADNSVCQTDEEPPNTAAAREHKEMIPSEKMLDNTVVTDSQPDACITHTALKHTEPSTIAVESDSINLPANATASVDMKNVVSEENEPASVVLQHTNFVINNTAAAFTPDSEAIVPLEVKKLSVDESLSSRQASVALALDETTKSDEPPVPSSEAAEIPVSDEPPVPSSEAAEIPVSDEPPVPSSEAAEIPVPHVSSVQSRDVNPKSSDPLDDFADIESFLGSMNDQTSLLLGGLDTMLNSNSRTVSKKVSNRGDFLFDEDVVTVDDAEVSTMGTSEVQKQNNQLVSQLKFLKAEINAREKTIEKVTSELHHLREELRMLSSDGSPRTSTNKKSLDTPSVELNNDLFSASRDHQIADDLFIVPATSRSASQARTSNLFSADEDEGESVSSLNGPAMNELSKENTKLRNEVAVLTNDLRNRDTAVMQLRRDKSEMLESLAQEREAQERRSGRRSSSARGVLKNQLDLMGFGSSEVEFAVEALQEDSVLTDSVDHSMQSLFSSPKLNTSRSDTSATYGLDSSWNMSQDGIFARREATDDSSAIRAPSVSARQRLNDHGLFSSDTRAPSSDKNEFLFKDDVPIHDEPPKVRPNNTSVSDNKSFDYQDFVYRLMSPECSDLVDVIRRFLLTIYGPNGDCSAPDKKTKLPYVFHGTKDMASRCCDFFDAMIEHFSSHPAWAGETEERMKSARDCLERYMMNKLADIAFKTVEVPEEDEALLRKMKCLTFVPASALDIKDEMNNDIVWALARDELRKINSYKTPGEKIDCVVRCAAVIFRTLNLARAKSGESPAGADDFLPIFIYVVMHSQVPQLVTNCEYIQCFHNPDNLRSKAGYCFVNLRSAMEFILYLDGEGLSMDREEFCAKLEQAERDFDKA